MGPSLGFNEKKLSGGLSDVFWEIKNENKNLPASSVFKKKMA